MSELHRNFRTRFNKKNELKMKLTKLTILNYKLMIHDKILGGKHVI